jgi:hypothetical protein
LKDAFKRCSGLTSVKIPGSLIYIDDGAFSWTGLKDVEIPNGVAKIGGWAFANCDKLTTVTIPQSVIYIGNYTFFDCPLLTSVTVLNPVPPIIGDGNKTEGRTMSDRYDMFFGEYGRVKDATLYVPKDYVSAYRRAQGWGNFRKVMPLQR